MHFLADVDTNGPVLISLNLIEYVHSEVVAAYDFGSYSLYLHEEFGGGEDKETMVLINGTYSRHEGYILDRVDIMENPPEYFIFLL